MKTWQTIVLIALIAAGLYVALVGDLGRTWKINQLAGLSIMVPAFCLWGLARLQLGMSFSGEARATALVTTGLYSKIRNPIYVFGGIFLVGLFTFVNPYLLLLMLVIVPVQVVRLRKESAVLEEAFGDAYRDYKRQTWF